jgi:hypothetical protein
LLLTENRYGMVPMGPALQPDPGYPVHVRILLAKSLGTNGTYHGVGSGNILATAPGMPVRGFDFTDSCSTAFNPNDQPDEFYQARWKKDGQKIEILMQRIGGSRTSRCELNLTLKDRPYADDGKPQVSSPRGPH